MESCKNCHCILNDWKIIHECREHAKCIINSKWDPSQCENCQALIADMRAESIPNDSSRFLLGWVRLINSFLSALPSSKPGDSVFANPDLAENYNFPFLTPFLSLRFSTPRRASTGGFSLPSTPPNNARRRTLSHNEVEIHHAPELSFSPPIKLARSSTSESRVNVSEEMNNEVFNRDNFDDIAVVSSPAGSRPPSVEDLLSQAVEQIGGTGGLDVENVILHEEVQTDNCQVGLLEIASSSKIGEAAVAVSSTCQHNNYHSDCEIVEGKQVPSHSVAFSESQILAVVSNNTNMQFRAPTILSKSSKVPRMSVLGKDLIPDSVMVSANYPGSGHQTFSIQSPVSSLGARGPPYPLDRFPSAPKAPGTTTAINNFSKTLAPGLPTGSSPVAIGSINQVGPVTPSAPIASQPVVPSLANHDLPQEQESLPACKHWTGLLAVTNCDDSTWQLLNEETPPTFLSIPDSVLEWVDQNGLKVMGCPLANPDEVFVGCFNARYYAVILGRSTACAMLSASLKPYKGYLTEIKSRPNWVQTRGLLQNFSQFATPPIQPLSIVQKDSNKVEISITSEDWNLEKLKDKSFKTNLAVSNISFSSSLEYNKEVLDFLSAPGFTETSHIIEGAEQDNLTRPIEVSDRKKDCSLRSRALSAIGSLAMFLHSAQAISTFSSQANENTQKDYHFPMFIGLEGIHEVGRSCLEGLASSLLQEAICFRLELRQKSLVGIKELGLKTKLESEDPLSPSLFSVNAVKFVHDSIHSTAPRKIAMAQGVSRFYNPRGTNPRNVASYGNPNKAGQGSLQKQLSNIQHLLQGQAPKIAYANQYRGSSIPLNQRMPNPGSFRQPSQQYSQGSHRQQSQKGQYAAHPAPSTGPPRKQGGQQQPSQRGRGGRGRGQSLPNSQRRGGGRGLFQ